MEQLTLNNFTTKRGQVLEAVRELTSCTSLELSGHLGWQIHTITPRLTELKKAGLIESLRSQRLNNKFYSVYQIAPLPDGMVHEVHNGSL